MADGNNTCNSTAADSFDYYMSVTGES